MDHMTGPRVVRVTPLFVKSKMCSFDVLFDEGVYEGKYAVSVNSGAVTDIGGFLSLKSNQIIVNSGVIDTTPPSLLTLKANGMQKAFVNDRVVIMTGSFDDAISPTSLSENHVKIYGVKSNIPETQQPRIKHFFNSGIGLQFIIEFPPEAPNFEIEVRLEGKVSDTDFNEAQFIDKPAKSSSWPQIILDRSKPSVKIVENSKNNRFIILLSDSLTSIQESCNMFNLKSLDVTAEDNVKAIPKLMHISRLDNSAKQNECEFMLDLNSHDYRDAFTIKVLANTVRDMAGNINREESLTLVARQFQDRSPPKLKNLQVNVQDTKGEVAVVTGNFDEIVKAFGEDVVRIIDPFSRKESKAAKIMKDTFFQSGTGFSFVLEFDTMKSTAEIEIQIEGVFVDIHGNENRNISALSNGSKWPRAKRDTLQPLTSIQHIYGSMQFRFYTLEFRDTSPLDCTNATNIENIHLTDTSGKNDFRLPKVLSIDPSGGP
eukprot:UC4_evm1s1253